MNGAALALSAELRDVLGASDQEDHHLRFSHAKAMGRSAAHARHAMQSNYEQTVAMKIGAGAHSLLLGGPRLVSFPGKVMRGKEWAAFKAENLDALILSTRQLQTAEAIAASVRADPIASRVLFQPGMVYEQTIHWQYKGRKIRSTPDARSKGHLVDLKTTRDASIERFQWDALRSAYHGQLASYAKAMEADNGYPPRDVYILAVESRPPYPCSVHRLTPRALEKGWQMVTGWLDQILACEESGQWNGYTTDVVDMDARAKSCRRRTNRAPPR